MLPKPHRLTEKKDYQFVLKRGKMNQGKYFGLASTPTEELTKIGLIVSNKISKSSVERNRIRRIVRATCREFISNNKTGFMFVFLAKKPADRVNKEELKQDVITLLSRYEKTGN
jgi:ribonuclease P protein component